MKITSEIKQGSAGVPLRCLDRGDMFQVHSERGSCKYLILRKTKIFLGSQTPPTTGQSVIAMSMENIDDNGPGRVDHDFKLFQGIDMDRLVFPCGIVESLIIEMVMQ